MAFRTEEAISRRRGLVDGAPLPPKCDGSSMRGMFKDADTAESLSEVRAESAIPQALARDLEALSPMESDLSGVVHDVFRGCQLVVAKNWPAHTGGSLVSFGSLQLGLLRHGDELDLLYVAAPDVLLPKFCDQLAAHFETQSSVCAITSEGDLAAPGLTFNLRRVDVRLFLAQHIPELPSPAPNAVAANMAALCAREASETLLNSVPNTHVFRALSKFVRHWARQRGIYGTFLGFFGGPAWAVCCARVCQMYPQAKPAQLVLLFFRTLREWDWSQPFCILPPSYGRAEQTNPRNQQATTMSALLPIAAGISASPHVTETTSKIMLQELLRAYRKANHLDLARAGGPLSSDREQQPSNMDLSIEGRPCLASEPQFFKHFRHYLEVKILALDEGVMHKWFQWTKKFMSEFVPVFEEVGNTSVVLRPWPEVFVCKHADWPHGRAMFIGLQLERREQPDDTNCRYDLREPLVRLLETITAWPLADEYKGKFDLCIQHVRKSDVQQWLDSRARGEITGVGASNLTS